MTDDNLSFLEANTADSTTEQNPLAQVESVPVIETPKAPQENPNQPAPTEQVTTPKIGGYEIPLPKYLEAQAELRETKKRLAEIEAQNKQQAERPDPVLDPDAYHTYQQTELDNRLWNERVQMSEIMAKQVYGDDVVKAAYDAIMAQDDPAVGLKIRKSSHPFDEVVKWHKREQMLSEVGGDLSAYKAKIIADFQAQQQQTAAGVTPNAQQPTATLQAPPPSISRAPAGHKASDVPTGPGTAFDDVFAS